MERTSVVVRVFAQRGYQLAINKTGKKARAVEFADVPDSLYFDVKIRNEALVRLEELSRSGQAVFPCCGFLKPHPPFALPKDTGNSMPAGISLWRTHFGRVPKMRLRSPTTTARNCADIPTFRTLCRFLRNRRRNCAEPITPAFRLPTDNIGAILDRLKELGALRRYADRSLGRSRLSSG